MSEVEVQISSTTPHFATFTCQVFAWVYTLNPKNISKRRREPNSENTITNSISSKNCKQPTASILFQAFVSWISWSPQPMIPKKLHVHHVTPTKLPGHSHSHGRPSLKLTFLHLKNGWLEYNGFLLEVAYFQGRTAVSLGRVVMYVLWKQNISHTIHVWYIFTYIYHRNQPNVGKKIPYMDGMGMYESEDKSHDPSNCRRFWCHAFKASKLCAMAVFAGFLPRVLVTRL